MSGPIDMASLREVAAYIREEADFNRSWTDGRRGSGTPHPGYVERRLELAAERDRWADAIEAAITAISSGFEPAIPRKG